MSDSLTRKAVGNLRRFLRGDGVAIAIQPIADLGTGQVIGFEALARFDSDPPRSPAAWFRNASEAGMRKELELATARRAIAAIGDLPAGTYLTINASPDVATSAEFADVISSGPPERVIVEITEHAPIDDYDSLNRALRLLRDRGARVAIDDAGAGLANMAHILRLSVDVIKLDIELTRHIDIDAKRKALVASLVEFAGTVGATIIAEGIETLAELRALRTLGVRVGQGFYVGRPQLIVARPAPRSPSRWRRTVTTVVDALSLSRSPRATPFSRRRLVRPVALGMGALLLWPTAAAVAEGALPGSAGWWLKRRIEDARLLVALDRSSEVRLHLDFARRRLQELTELVARGDSGHAVRALLDYEKRVEAVQEFLPALARSNDGSVLRSRIQSDLADYVAELAEQERAVCATGDDGAEDTCVRILSSSKRSASTLEQIASLPKRKEVGIHAGHATSHATPVAELAPAAALQHAKQTPGNDPRSEDPKKQD